MFYMNRMLASKMYGLPIWGTEGKWRVGGGGVGALRGEADWGRGPQGTIREQLGNN